MFGLKISDLNWKLSLLGRQYFANLKFKEFQESLNPKTFA